MSHKFHTNDRMADLQRPSSGLPAKALTEARERERVRIANAATGREPATRRAAKPSIYFIGCKVASSYKKKYIFADE